MKPSLKALIIGFLSASALLVLYFLIVGFISGIAFSITQFERYWYFMLALSAGFGAQVGIYIHIRIIATMHAPSKAIVATSGVSSTAAMVACCAHYLAVILPVLGATGIASLIVGYQAQLFWIGLAINAGGLIYVVRQLTQFNREHHIMMQRQ
ncbi:MAG: hypothetical protein ACYCZ0_03565 [Minisyncoccota bacterium]